MKVVRPSPLLADVIEGFADWEKSDCGTGQVLSTRKLPSPCPILCVNYGVPALVNRKVRSSYHQHISGIETLYWRGGAVGVVCARVKPEAVGHLTGFSPRDLAAEPGVGLRDLYGGNAVSILEEQLAKAATTAERIQLVEAFLLCRLRKDRSPPDMLHAAKRLRGEPSLPAWRLASHLNISERHLSRAFRATFGISPKQFARLARIDRIARARWNGAAWADISHACGFFDQSHMINDFRALVGATPAELISEASRHYALGNAAIGRSCFSNFFLTAAPSACCATTTTESNSQPGVEDQSDTIAMADHPTDLPV